MRLRGLLGCNIHIPRSALSDLVHGLYFVLMSLFRQAKPYTAITVQIERITKPEYEVEDLSGIVDLIEVIKLQSSGPTEAARAIRKKL